MTANSFNEIRCKEITENIKIIKENVAVSAEKSGRKPEDIKIMAVTKTVDPVFINHAIDNCGIDLIGENRVQEYFSKKDSLHLDNCDVHLIGHLQTNKVKQIMPEVSMIQSVDSVRLAEEIGKNALKLNKIMNVLVEINIADEESKFGINKSELSEFIHQISEIKGVNVKGLMTIPPFSAQKHDLEKIFSDMYGFFIDIRSKKIDNIDMDILSMGMSGDYCEAIINGSNLVRIGSSMFGKRIY